MHNFIHKILYAINLRTYKSKVKITRSMYYECPKIQIHCRSEQRVQYSSSLQRTQCTAKNTYSISHRGNKYSLLLLLLPSGVARNVNWGKEGSPFSFFPFSPFSSPSLSFHSFPFLPLSLNSS